MHIDKYERYWILAVAAMLGVFFAALVAGAVVFGVRLPEPSDIINPLKLNETEFAQPGLRDMGDNQYKAVILAQMWTFNTGGDSATVVINPNGKEAIVPAIHVPVGAEVEFMVTSRDVIHGFIIEHKNVNMEIVPGQIARARAIFDEPGEYFIICHEYCGSGHQGMYGVVIVEDQATSEES